MKFRAFAMASRKQRNESQSSITIMDDDSCGEVHEEDSSPLHSQRRSEPSLFNPRHSC
jgi:hypothetical protein